MQMGNFLFVLFEVESPGICKNILVDKNTAKNIRDAHRFLVLCHETHHAMHGWAHTFYYY